MARTIGTGTGSLPLLDHSTNNNSCDDVSMDSSPEHYIHSRIKSSLGSGIKEIPYSGVTEGDSLRRVASLNAEAKNKICSSSMAKHKVNGHHDACAFYTDLNLPPAKQAKSLPASKVSPQLGYVRRLAAVNARACLSAIMKSESNKSGEEHVSGVDDSAIVECKDRLLPYSASSRQPSILGSKRKISPFYNCNGNNSKKKKIDEKPPLSAPDSLQQSILAESSAPVNSDPVFNKLGLLYNSDCIHPSVRVYLSNEGKTTNDLIIPKVIPKNNLQSIIQRECAVNTKYKALKHDNGWSPIGDSIKTIVIRSTTKEKKRIRKYYVGIRRKGEMIFARDCILLRSIRAQPYVAKIGSIWRESGGLMLTVFWYYRPDDTDKYTAELFHENEVLASQHYDDISVACVDDKCLVLGLYQYCRQRAQLQRQSLGLPTTDCLIPSTCAATSTTTTTSTTSTKDTAADGKDAPSEVYLCYRAYNHIAGKLTRLTTTISY